MRRRARSDSAPQAAVGLSYAVGKAAAGALEYLPVARVGNLASTIDELKKRGVWIYGADMDGSPWCRASLTGPIALVVGSEGRGVGRLIREKCDGILSLPMKGNISSPQRLCGRRRPVV